MRARTVQRAPDPYASRRGGAFGLAERPDPVVWGAGAGPLDASELARYERDGFLSVMDLLPASRAAGLRAEAHRLRAAARPDAEEVVIEPDSDVVRSVFQVHERSEAFARVIRHPRLLAIAHQILGSPVYLHQSRINFKPALDGREFFWHSDFETWHVEDGMPRPRAFSVSLALTDNHEFNGPLIVVPGSHRAYLRCPGGTPREHHRESLRRQRYGVPDRASLRRLMAGRGLVAPKGRAGSAVIFDANLMHASAGNLSPEDRVNLFLVYNSVENRLEAPFSELPPRPAFLAARAVCPLEAEA